jgi:hypothetical protein
MTLLDESSDTPTDAPSRRRSFLPRFGLRALFVFAVLFCLASAWVGRNIHRTRQADAAIETLGRAGAAYGMHGERSSGSAKEVQRVRDELIDRWEETTIVDRAIGRSFRPRIRGVVFDDRNAPESTMRAAIEGMTHLPEIEGVVLWGPFFDDATCDTLARLPNLESLRLRGTRITARGLLRLESLPNLQSLTLIYPEATDALAALPRLKRLRTLSLCNLVVTRDAIAGVATLPELQWLELTSVQSDEEGAFRPLSGATNLRTLIIISDSFSDEDLPPLSHLKDLERLTVRVEHDASLRHFAGLSKLRRLDLSGGVTPDAARRFSAEHPELLIRVRESPIDASVRFRNGVSLDGDANDLIEEAIDVD